MKLSVDEKAPRAAGSVGAGQVSVAAGSCVIGSLGAVRFLGQRSVCIQGMKMSRIPIYVINLDRRPDRLAGISGQLATLALEFERIAAVDGKTEPVAHLDAETRAHGPIGPLSSGTRACTMSHFRAWVRFLESKASHAVILEDDALVLPEFASLVQDANWLPRDVALLKLEKFNPDKVSKILLGPVMAQVPETGAALRRMYSRHCGSAGYLISRDGARRALTFRGRIDVPIDHFLFNATVSHQFHHSLRPAMLVPPVVAQDTDSTTDRAGRDDTPVKSWQRRLLSLRRALAEARLWHRQIFWLIIGRARLVPVAFANPGQKSSRM